MGITSTEPHSRVCQASCLTLFLHLVACVVAHSKKADPIKHGSPCEWRPIFFRSSCMPAPLNVSGDFHSPLRVAYHTRIRADWASSNRLPNTKFGGGRTCRRRRRAGNRSHLDFPPTFLDFKSKVVMNLLCDGCDPRAKFAIMWRLFLQVLQRFSFLYEDFSRRSL